MKNEKLNSRDSILAKIKANQPEYVGIANPITHQSELQILTNTKTSPPPSGVGGLFSDVLRSIGGQTIEVQTYSDVVRYIRGTFDLNCRIISTLPQLNEIADNQWLDNDPHDLADVELLIIEAHFGVAENGSVWVTEDLLGQRAAPFITQNLAIILQKQSIVQTMHQAYERIGLAVEYGFGTFIAGPSKTADIEQSLVLGAHGSRTMTVFVME
jgi:L-lactate dehydrogenase complex protein LldG